MFSLLIAATLSFDTQMSMEEQERTGLTKLTIQEKRALQNWLEEHQTKKGTSPSKKKEPIVQEVLRGGKFIRLSDDTLWEINQKDTPITQSWITPTEIKVTSSDDPDYPFTLLNTLTGSIVRARKAPPHSQ